MQGTIAQIVALVLEGNAVIRGIDSIGMDQSYSTMSFCEFVRFADLAKTPTGWSERQVAEDPKGWFRYLKERGFTALRMTHGPSNDPNLEGSGVTDRMLVGFVGGGGRWLIQASKPNSSDYWEARWVVGDQQRSDQRIWRVTYGRVARSRPGGEFEQVDLRALREHFCGVLEEIKTFATRQGLDGFANCFARALEDLGSESPENGFHKELLNRSLLPMEAVQLLSAAQSSWVFGGMGSWNDLGFDSQDQDIRTTIGGALPRVQSSDSGSGKHLNRPSAPRNVG